jgi:AraC-like DNA-binding protein
MLDAEEARLRALECTTADDFLVVVAIKRNSGAGDPTLNPTDIACQHGLSLRYLHKIFDVTGQSVSEYIRRRRLKPCCEDLMDPTSRHLHIGQLSMRWGFTDAAHFSHVFRGRYGQSPREFRKLMRSRADEKFS